MHIRLCLGLVMKLEKLLNSCHLMLFSKILSGAIHREIRRMINESEANGLSKNLEEGMKDG